jgi:predicted metal-dependent phosphoesterase TrpH
MFSDGTYTPRQLIEQAKRAGLSAIAVVDHDTLAGLGSALKEAGQGLEVLSGVELTAEEAGLEIHILGYLIDRDNPQLLESLEVLRKNRLQRIYRISEKLQTLGLNLKAEEVFSLAQGETVGRLHVARAMLKKDLVKSLTEAFQKYIGDNAPAHVLGFRLSPQEAVRLIKDAGGIPIVAHPHTFNDDAVLFRLLGYGVMGIEAYYPDYTQSTTKFYLELAARHNLLVTGGSDFHGEAKPDIKIGAVRIPYELVEKLKQAKLRSQRGCP